MNIREIMSGQRKDPLAVLLRGCCWLAQFPYLAVVRIRNRRFDTGRREVHRADVPVISIGNLTTGGTGKTPLVCFLAQYIRRQHVRVAIVSRGYGAAAGEENDEALELARELPDVPHVQDADRVEAARIACEELEAQVILMDDGFQHRRLARDLDIVVIDATNPFGYGHALPRGMLREPIASLSRAQAVVISRADLVEPHVRQQVIERVQRAAPQAIVAEAEHKPVGLLQWPNERTGLSSIQGQPVLLLSAIGNPQAFASSIKQCGANIVDVMTLPDHDAYDAETVQRIIAWLNRFEDKSIQIICTQKDIVKLQTDRLADRAVSALLIELRLTSGREPLIALVDRVIANIETDV